MESDQPERVTSTAHIYRREEGVFLVVEQPVDRYGVAEAKENMTTLAELSDGQPVRMIVDVRKAKALSREARKYYTGPHAGHAMKALALLIGSPTSRVIANFFIRLSRPSVPMKLFNSEQEAIAWIKGVD